MLISSKRAEKPQSGGHVTAVAVKYSVVEIECSAKKDAKSGNWGKQVVFLNADFHTYIYIYIHNQPLPIHFTHPLSLLNIPSYFIKKAQVFYL